MSQSSNIIMREAMNWVVAGVIIAGAVYYFDEIKLFARDASGIEAPSDGAAGATPRVANMRSDARPTRSSGGYVVELPAARDGHFYATARINSRPIDVLVDTGASLVALSYEDAERAGIYLTDRDFKYVANTANGKAKFAKVRLSRVEIDGITVYDVVAGVAQPGRQDVTLLGMSFLNKLRRVEMQNGRLILED